MEDHPSELLLVCGGELEERGATEKFIHLYSPWMK